LRLAYLLALRGEKGFAPLTFFHMIDSGGFVVNCARKKRHGPERVDDPRTHCVSSHLNLTELNQLDRQRSRLGLARGEYLRCAGLDKLPPMIPELNQIAWVELSRAAGNLNQLAKALNQNNDVSHDEIIQELKEFRAALIGAKL
jgi:hypothetical protein